MKFQILIYLVAIFIFSRLTHQQTTPQERCEVSKSGSVCMDCFRRANCIYNEDGTVTVEFADNCPSQSYCDDSLYDPEYYYGKCAPLPAPYTNCSCYSSTQCIADPNNPGVVLHCESDPPVTDPPCQASEIDLSKCGCVSCSDECPLADDPSDDCANYFVCSGNDLIQERCLGTSCFDQSSCGCVIRESTTPTPTPSPDCPFIDDPNDDCGGYFIFNGTALIPLSCVGGFCFDQTLCGCVEREPSSTSTSVTLSTSASTTTTTTLSPNCPLYDDPNDSCGRFFYFDGVELIPQQCPESFCFNQTLCGCVFNGGSLTTPPKTKGTVPVPLPCPPDCPYVHNPNEDCGRFFICDDSGIDIPLECPGSLCFDETTCQCD